MAAPITLRAMPDAAIHVVYRQREVEFTAVHPLESREYKVRIPISRLKQVVGKICAMEGEAEQKEKSNRIVLPE